MLSISQVTNAGAAGSYYQSDNYYAKDEGNGVWYGSAAVTLGMDGQPVDPDHFVKALSGEMENGQILGRIVDNERKHIAGYDMTFSAPKSLSILTEVLGDTKLSTAHDKAVRTTLDWVEKNALQTRIYNKKTNTQDYVKDQKMIAALFKHDVSRNEDPQLHTHSVITNAVLDAKDKWRSIDSHPFFQHKMLIGMIYRSELTRNIRVTGIDIQRTHPDGRFEIDGMDSQLIQAFSTRSHDIKEYLGEGAHSAQDKANAALRTRKGKHETSRDVLSEKWKAQITKLGLTPESIKRSLKHYSYTQGFEIGNQKNLSFEFDTAISHLSETSSVFTKDSVLRHTLSEGLGKMLIGDAVTEFDKAIADKRVHISLDEKYIYTTATLQRETNTLDLERKGRARVDPIALRNSVSKIYNGYTLTKGQFNASKLILTSPNLIIGVQGLAGTGKTFMLASTARQAEAQGYKILGMAPTSNAVTTLAADANIKAQTIQKYLMEPSGGKKAILFVDESSMVTTRQMLDLLTIAHDRKLAKVVLIGDTKQLEGVGAGAPFKALQKEGMRFALMDEIKRQKKERHLDAVISASKGDIDRAFKKLSSDVRETSLENLAKETANIWLNSKRDKAAIVVTTNNMADSVNAHIKQSLQAEGFIAKDGWQIDSLKSIRLSETQKRFADNYHEADVVRFNKAYRRLGVFAGEALRIKSIDKNDIVHLSKNGGTIAFKPSRDARASGAVEAFKITPMEIHAGDQIRWRRKEYQYGIENMQRGKVEAIYKDNVTIKMQDGRSLDLAKDHPHLSFLSHAWAQTGHAYQGQTIDHIIAVMPSLSGLTTQKGFYTAISRARHEVTFLTDNVQRIQETLAERAGDSRTAIELHREKSATPVPEVKTPEPVRELTRTRTEHVR